jgi:hypothetical protein
MKKTRVVVHIMVFMLNLNYSTFVPIKHFVNVIFRGQSCALTVLAETVVRLRLRLPPPAS